jgi:hypothetical protein
VQAFRALEFATALADYNFTPNQHCVVESGDAAQPCWGTGNENHPKSPSFSYGNFKGDVHIVSP